MEHLRIDPRIDHHPDVLEAGFAGATVFQAILRAVAEFDKHGRLPGKFGPRWLVRRMNIEDGDVLIKPEQFVIGAIERCVRAGLLARDGDDLVVPGWDTFYKPAKTPAERQAAYAERKKKRRRNADASDAADETHATSLHTTPHHTTSHKESISSASQPEPNPEVPLLTPEDEQRTSSVGDVLAHYCEAMKANNLDARVTMRRKRIVRQRLREGWTVDELKRAVDGLTWSDWHMGRDPKTCGQAWTDLKYCLGTPEKVEEFIAKAEAANVPAQRPRL